MSRNHAFPPSAGDFLLASKRCEITVLQQLLQMGQLVGRVSQLIHVLQRERGTVNIYLCSQGALFGERLEGRVQEVELAKLAVQRQLMPLDDSTAPLASASRLFSRIACALHHLTSLPALRRQVQQRQILPPAAMGIFNDIIHSLLALVFEAADACAEPTTARALIAMFSFMQGKELAGQERAIGAAGFASMHFDESAHQRLLVLIEGQERCFATFSEFADEPSLAQWRRMQQQDDREFERLRRIACTQLQLSNQADTSLRWFEITSARIDLMKQIEDRLEEALMVSCRNNLTQAQRALATDCTDYTPQPVRESYAVFVAAPLRDASPLVGDGLHPRLGRSMLELIQQQSQRLHALSEELATARATLSERKQIERAKALLIQHRGLTEEEAHRLLLKMAMNQNQRLIDIANAMLAVADILPSRGNTP
ncbi:nitrate regulatory protein [Serratia quinivorans]|uniref:nitrate regulatory protein n=1 Tax=Serratia quinivorans TaxID=137545 RepID=UPI0021772F3D|nr:nitrate regulatory protein [Serratia quinivorans]CAI0759616.1 Nitrate and nitrite sensing [Serratia quinivorans]CAI0764556.1 Nitrate and nitrite sensing [Serratia quinivorans]CAI0786637.1 Nitrate and nitrite sensing [Serratia quinivorans]CAI1695049.1 Nitrate and nitrite sensing [Serratia quinivorans]CAI2058176.1 Nitrate and nitrite sensing [Serratia quinivorans]